MPQYVSLRPLFYIRKCPSTQYRITKFWLHIAWFSLSAACFSSRELTLPHFKHIVYTLRNTFFTTTWKPQISNAFLINCQMNQLLMYDHKMVCQSWRLTEQTWFYAVWQCWTEHHLVNLNKFRNYYSWIKILIWIMGYH